MQNATQLKSLILVLEGEAFNEVYMTQNPDPMNEYKRIEIALDSGAGEHVANRNVAAEYPVDNSAGSRAGKFHCSGRRSDPEQGPAHAGTPQRRPGT